MGDERTDIHTPYASRPSVTNKVVQCIVCGTQWQSKGPADREGHCRFCGANSEKGAFVIIDETPDYGDAEIVSASR